MPSDDESHVKKRHLPILLLLFLFGIALNPGCGDDDHDDSAADDESDGPDDDDNDSGDDDGFAFRVQVDSAPYFGDLWPSAWAWDDALYFAWGDGTGQEGCIPSIPSILDTPFDEWEWERCSDGRFWIHETCAGLCPVDQQNFCRLYGCGPDRCYPLCTLARAGIRRDVGLVDALPPCSSHQAGDPPVRQDACIVALDPPDQDFLVDRKVSSLLFLGGDKLLAHIHSPCCDETRFGFIMYNDGAAWTVVSDDTYPDDTPWGEGSHFRVGMFIQMGRNHELSLDGYVYMLGMDYEVDPLLQNQAVYLARVPSDQISGPGYDSWEYLTHDKNAYSFSPDQSAAVPVAGDLGNTTNPGGGTIAQGSAMYHAGLKKFIFLTGIVDLDDGDDADTLDGAVYLADAAYGPWTRVHTWEDSDNHGFVPGLIAKDAGPNCVYYAYAGLPEATVLTYNRHIDALIFRTPCDADDECGCSSRCVGGLCALSSLDPDAP